MFGLLAAVFLSHASRGAVAEVNRRPAADRNAFAPMPDAPLNELRKLLGLDRAQAVIVHEDTDGISLFSLVNVDEVPLSRWVEYVATDRRYVLDRMMETMVFELPGVSITARPKVEREKRSDNYVVVGDFNALPGSPVHRYLRDERGLVDAFSQVLSLDEQGSRAFPTAGFLNLRMHLDHVYSSAQLEWLDFSGTERFGARGGAFAGLSDHVPLIARFRVPAR